MVKFVSEARVLVTSSTAVKPSSIYGLLFYHGDGRGNPEADGDSLAELLVGQVERCLSEIAAQRGTLSESVLVVDAAERCVVRQYRTETSQSPSSPVSHHRPILTYSGVPVDIRGGSQRSPDCVEVVIHAGLSRIVVPEADWEFMPPQSIEEFFDLRGGATKDPDGEATKILVAPVEMTAGLDGFCRSVLLDEVEGSRRSLDGVLRSPPLGLVHSLEGLLRDTLYKVGALAKYGA